MEWVFFPLVGILGWVLGVVGFFKSRRALNEIKLLRVALAGAPVAAAPEHAWAAAAAPEPSVEPEAVAPEPVAPEPVLAAPVPEPIRPRADLEVLLTQRWGVWLGAAALLLAAVFLVRTAVEQGWLGPGPRCALAGLLGLALLAGAEWLRRRPGAATGLADFAPSALAAGAVGAWFAGAYGAGPLYGLVPPVAGFVLLASAGLAGMALSLRYGKLVGVVGLVGAFVTPVLVASDDVSLAGLFGYLLFVSAAAWAVVRFTAWTWLGWGAAVLGAMWVVVAAFGPRAEAWAPGLFVPAAVALSLFLLPGAALGSAVGRRLLWVPVALLGLAGVALAGLSGDEMARFGVLVLAPITVVKGWREPRLAWLPHLAAVLFLLVLLTWALPAWQATGEAVVVGEAVLAVLPGAWAPTVIVPLLETAGAMAAWFAAAGLFLERRSVRPVPWASLAGLVPVATLAVTYAQVGQFQPPMVWAFAAAGLAAALVGAAWWARPGDAGVQRAGMYGAGAVAALALGFAIVFDRGWLTVAVALMLPPLAWIEGVAGLPPLRRVALITAAVVLVRLVLNPYVLDYEVGSWPVLNGMLAAYGLPAVCFAAASVMFRRRADDVLVAVLEGGGCAFFAVLASLEVHHWAVGGVLRSVEPGLLEFALHVSVLGAVGLLLQRVAARGGRFVVLVAARIVGGVALAGGVLLILANPVVTDDVVGTALLGNALLPAYAVPGLLAVVAVLMGARPRNLLASYAVAAGFMWITLSVRHAFHREGMGVDVGVEDAELWAYSGAWLVMGAGLMTVGLREGVRSLRLAALALVGLATAKVFLVDMAGLDGLWRVLSFLGLGVSLIGLGAFYRRFLVGEVVRG